MPHSLLSEKRTEPDPEYQTKDKTEKSLTVLKVGPSHHDLELLVVDELKHGAFTTMKEAITQGIEETIKTVFDLGFQNANTGITRAFSTA